LPFHHGEHTANAERALYQARVEDIGEGDVLVVECECGCGHVEELTPAMLATAGVKPYTKCSTSSAGSSAASAGGRGGLRCR